MRINWVAENWLPYDGYGRHAMFMVRALLHQGIQVCTLTRTAVDDFLKMPDWIKLTTPMLDWHSLTITLSPGDKFPYLPSRQWGFTMWETSKLPDKWAARINDTCERLLVPCEQNAQVFKANGVLVPISVIPEGIDPAEWPIVDPRPVNSRPFTFFAMGDRGPRKGIETAWSAFYHAFPQEQYPDVRLLIKCREGSLNGLYTHSFTDPRIIIWREDVERFSDVFVHADCFVFPSYGEGWGLPPRECAAMGIPVIASAHTGLLEGGIDNYAIPIRAFIEGDSPQGNSGGKWWIPDFKEVARQMKWVYDNQVEAKQRALKAAQWLRDNQQWSHAAQSLIRLVKEYEYATQSAAD